uniref:Nucleolar 27S pre-rRNA processing Urb2/Npa2 C-terminal domain-containing protein n=1 Tax=Cacopsylla melanoneura TaxID=428564 RepID=A0A8D8UCT8_9HEMI
MACSTHLDIQDLERSELSLKEKLTRAYSILVTPNTQKPHTVEEILQWFAKSMEEYNDCPKDTLHPKEEIFRILDTFIQSNQMALTPIYQMKFHIMETLLELLNVQEQFVSKETYIQCCLSLLNLENFVKCLEGDAFQFIKFSSKIIWIFSTPGYDQSVNAEERSGIGITYDLLIKMVSVLKKIKWNLDLSLRDMTDALACVATLKHWSSFLKDGKEDIKLIFEQIFYCVVTKDGSLCGILLTSFHDETILVKHEYSNIFNLLTLLRVIPTQNKAYVTGEIFAFLLNTTNKVCDDYFGNISYVFEKLDSIIRNKDIDYYEIGRHQKITSIHAFECWDHWMKMVYIYKKMTQFLVDNNIASNLPINIDSERSDTLEDLCTEIANCLMFMLGVIHTNVRHESFDRIVSDIYSVLLSIFSFAPCIAVKTFTQFKKHVIQTQTKQNLKWSLYDKVFATILSIHFKLSKEVAFLEILFSPPTEDLISNCWVPESYKSTLHQIFSGVSCERILAGWFSCIVAHFNAKSIKKHLSKNNYHMYWVCTSLSNTLEVILVRDSTVSSETAVCNKRTQLLNDIKHQLGQMKTILEHNDHKQNEDLYACFLQVCVHWGAFHLMCNKYYHEKFDSDYYLKPGDPAIYVLHNYFTLKDWEKISNRVTTIYRHNESVMNAWSELFAQVLDILYLYHNVDMERSPEQLTAEYLVNHSCASWLVRRVPLIVSHLSAWSDWKLAEKLSLHFAQNCALDELYTVARTETSRIMSKEFNQLCEHKFQVFGIAFHALKKAIDKMDSKLSSEIDSIESEMMDVAINELWSDQDRKSVKKKKKGSSDDDNASKTESSHSDKSDDEDEMSIVNVNKVQKETNSKDKESESSESEESDTEIKKRKSKESEDSDTSEIFSEVIIKKRKLNPDILIDAVNIMDILIQYLIDDNSVSKDVKIKISGQIKSYVTVAEALPIEHLENPTQQILFLLVLVCSRVSNATAIRHIISRLLLSKHFSIPSCQIIPYLLTWINDTGSTSHMQEALVKLCKLSAQDENTVKVMSKLCELPKKKLEDINIEQVYAQGQITYYFLHELNSYKTNNNTLSRLRNKVISSAYQNFKNLKLKPTENILLLFGFMLHKSLKEHDSQSIDALCFNLNDYLDLALVNKNATLVELILTYSNLTLKKYIPQEFIPKVWTKLPSCANLCFQSASLVQFNEFLDQMYKDTEELLKSNTCDPDSMEKNFNVWRKLLSSHLSRNTNVARLAKLESVIFCMSTHVSLYSGGNIDHFPMILQLVLDIVYSPVFTCVNTSIVQFLFNLITPKSCSHFKHCTKLLQYLITKKASIISDETALFLLKFHQLLSHIVKYVCSDKCADGESDVLLIAMSKVAHAIRKEKKYFQRVVPYTLSNIVQLYQVNKFPIGVTVQMNEISNIFISICDEHAINLLKHSLPDGSKQLFLQTLQNYHKYSSQRFV